MKTKALNSVKSLAAKWAVIVPISVLVFLYTIPKIQFMPLETGFLHAFGAWIFPVFIVSLFGLLSYIASIHFTNDNHKHGEMVLLVNSISVVFLLLLITGYTVLLFQQEYGADSNAMLKIYLAFIGG